MAGWQAGRVKPCIRSAFCNVSRGGEERVGLINMSGVLRGEKDERGRSADICDKEL